MSDEEALRWVGKNKTALVIGEPGSKTKGFCTCGHVTLSDEPFQFMAVSWSCEKCFAAWGYCSVGY
jgi:hypothetical protein